MRRWLVILLLALLPLQFSWAAVAAYCGHETGRQAQHMGHHAHQHGDQAQALADLDSAPADQAAPAGFDLDCGHCHGAGASMPAPVGDLLRPAPAARTASAAEGRLRTRAQTPPERPQWPALA